MAEMKNILTDAEEDMRLGMTPDEELADRFVTLRLAEKLYPMDDRTRLPRYSLYGDPFVKDLLAPEFVRHWKVVGAMLLHTAEYAHIGHVLLAYGLYDEHEPLAKQLIQACVKCLWQTDFIGYGKTTSSRNFASRSAFDSSDGSGLTEVCYRCMEIEDVERYE